MRQGEWRGLARRGRAGGEAEPSEGCSYLPRGGCHSSAGSALSCGREFAGSNLQFAFVTSVSEQTLFCIPSDGIKLQSGGGHYSGCHNVQNLPYSMARVR